MKPVESSAIDAVDYDPKRRKLVVTFAGGATYAYAGVPAAKWKALLAADSKGRFVNREIKPHFPATRLSARSGSSPRSAA
ncbi:KTSC domain-containing protein [Enterovirga aerilata]|uniref:KTSC domain-containing protein n=1 Tax=Enterovirga aerilata TaxID=2730920 RepID=A0A849I3U8_9HYPH|nr:KTSC domain-containing protein [Enterovirga sp. DB1703]NNM74102.1 KTSC domain-containing protein [Enterovirga sp. DB1703]